ncbi:hypothetical protein EDC56_3733 [Sinobacterium caligoides]|uniref:3-methylmercaptopropionyl-CoA dehydrogenase n=1 Tax=Sinobacterium caligoides TaxID=933926 RepID=A0A3N2D5L4_9GAMM|nr:acyl-CoA dehydrogenase C-terminal domain-containing protein [Sinobacterium caligoides]ROR94918.1 hypothetical protein EDC56_3733 [Sinobacterium caligoides]
MKVFKSPIKDIQFVTQQVFDIDAHYKTIPQGAEATPEMVAAISQECAKFSENVLFPLNQSGDAEGCSFKDGQVTTPAGFKEAYQQWVDNGWQGLSHPEEYGGQGLPLSLGVIKSEIVGTANWSFGMYPGLSLGAMNTLIEHGTEEQKRGYLSKLVEGSWTGTMCLTESNCGSDLGQMKSKAVPSDDGSYRITGSKIFISSGEHDLAENIVHIVLARIEGETAGTKGISLFIVPKILPNDDLSLGEANQVSCGSIEHKMGINGSATCTMNFDGSKGFLLGEKNKGVNAMFTFMNTARIGTAIQGIGAAELAFQNSLAYAKERRSMRTLGGPVEPQQAADSIIHHPDVRRMLLKQKAIAGAGRAMLYDAAMIADKMMAATDDKEREAVDSELGFITPILKGFFTEMGIEAANEGMQVFGGHGYIKEWGMEQISRDVRIATLYEGTTGIQGLDLLGRKVILDKFKQYGAVNKRILNLYKRSLASPHRWQMMKFIGPLMGYQLRWQRMLLSILLAARKDRDAVGAATHDFLMFSGYLMSAYYWALMALTAFEKLAQKKSDSADLGDDFYQSKIQTAEFYYARMLPRAKSHSEIVRAKLSSLTAMAEKDFCLE